MSQFEEMTSKIDELFNDVSKYRKSSEFKALIEFVSKFKTLSPFNSMLAHIQRPDSKFLLRASEWKKLYERNIKADARPIIILVPFGPVDFLFEVSDTYPISPKLDGEDNILDYLAQPYAIDGKIDHDSYHNLLENLPNCGIHYTKFRVGSEFAGKIDISKSKEPLAINIGNKKQQNYIGYKPRFTLAVNDTYNKEAEFSTICHELGHLLCFHIASPNNWWRKRNLDHATEEFEAEVVSKIVCEHFGINSHSEKYLVNFFQENETIPRYANMEIMWNAAHEIIKMVQRVSVENGLIYKYDKEFKSNYKEYKAQQNKKKEDKKATPSKDKLPQLPFKD